MDPYGVPVHQAPPPPFDAPAARRLREALGMATGHVAYGLRAQYGLQIPPETVAAWERGIVVPSQRELTALAGVLWCAPSELLTQATTLREHRVARGLSAEDLARRVGLDSSSYRRMEDSGRWRGNERQTAALAGALELGPRELLTATGRDGDLAGLLRDAVGARWQAYVRPVSKMLPMDRGHLEDVLQQLHTDYQSRMVATLSWGPSSEDTGEAGRDFLDRIVDHFWALARA
ncbi:helix-turn-helix transcriptional regulator [Streptomyces sp. NPDC051907]|uniref:helix-turn-helix domain-containing protein n=1 Tax=Streptomyces sp. NPDC051907 TaxID=3155284 RepID=UPI003427EE86